MSFKRHIPKIVGTLIVLGVGVLMVDMVRDFLNTPAATPPRGPQQVTLLTPPPPPPPPQEKPPEPEIEDEVKIEEPEPLDDLPEEASDEPPPGSDLGVDAEGGAGGDGFGLIGRKGGRGLLDGAGDPFRYYASQLQRQIENALVEHDELRKKNYSVTASVEMRDDGSVLRAQLEISTGDRETDAMMIDVITRMQALSQSPPPDMPQPIRLRISSRL
jgi:periplasmic protein TonB